MTANQIAYSKVAEDRRHNVVYEQETQRHNVETEGIGWQQAAASKMSAEAARTQGEAARVSAQASMRHADAAIISAGAAQLGAQASILGAQAAQEHYERADAIQAEYNSGIIELQAREQDTKRMQVVGQNIVNMKNATTQALRQSEEARHNRQQEQLGASTVQESRRHNLATESLTGAVINSQNFKNYSEAFKSITSGVREASNVVGGIVIGGKYG